MHIKRSSFFAHGSLLIDACLSIAILSATILFLFTIENQLSKSRQRSEIIRALPRMISVAAPLWLDDSSQTIYFNSDFQHLTHPYERVAYALQRHPISSKNPVESISSSKIDCSFPASAPTSRREHLYFYSKNP